MKSNEEDFQKILALVRSALEHLMEFHAGCPFCADYQDKDDPEPHESPNCLWLELYNFLLKAGVDLPRAAK